MQRRKGNYIGFKKLSGPEREPAWARLSITRLGLLPSQHLQSQSRCCHTQKAVIYTARGAPEHSHKHTHMHTDARTHGHTAGEPGAPPRNNKSDSTSITPRSLRLLSITGKTCITYDNARERAHIRGCHRRGDELPRLMELYGKREHSARWHIIFELRRYHEESSYLDASRGGDDSQISRTLQPSGRKYQEVRRLLKLL